MFDSPEFMKALYGFLATSITGIAGVGYKKIQKINYDIEIRPTKEETEEMIDSKVSNLEIKQDFTIQKLEDLHRDVNRLEDVLIKRGKYDS